MATVAEAVLPGASEPTAVVQPLPVQGPYAVACSNVVQDFDQLLLGEDPTSYWEGLPDDDRPRYITDLLADPGQYFDHHSDRAAGLGNSMVRLPDRRCRSLLSCATPLRIITPAPTIQLWLTDRVVPHMQTGSDAPLFADESVRYPVVAFSHGYMGSPISSDDYMKALTVCASYGYVVIAPFHGDLRFSESQNQRTRLVRSSRGIKPGKLHRDAGPATAFDIRGA